MKQPLTLLFMILLGDLCLLSAVTTAQSRQGDELKPQDAGAPDAVRAPNGKIVVVGPDGKKRELDTSNSAGIILKQSVQSVMENGEKQTRVQGKAVVIGPDGKRTEFDLAEPLETDAGDRIMKGARAWPHRTDDSEAFRWTPNCQNVFNRWRKGNAGPRQCW